MEMTEFPIVIVGCGPGSPEYLTLAGRTAIEGAEVLVGAPRLLETLSSDRAEQIPVGNDISKVLDAIAPHAGRKKVAVLVTGDPGLCSLAKPVIRRFGRRFCRVIPGISAVQTAFARLGLDWEDAFVISAHRRLPSIDPGTLSGRKKIVVLAGGENSRPWLQAAGSALEPNFEIFVCSNLTLENETVDCIPSSALAAIPLPPRCIVLFINKECLQ